MFRPGTRRLASFRTGTFPGTLGAVLYASPSRAFVSEAEWVALVRSVAEGDQSALHALYERAHRAVFTFAMRVTGNGESAEEVTLHVFHGVWRHASHYQEADGTVLGLIMNQAHSRVISGRRFDQRENAYSLKLGFLPGNWHSPPRRPHRIQAAEPIVWQRTGRPHARREKCDRGGILLRIDVRRGRGTVERATRNDKASNPLWVAQASRGVGRRRAETMTSTLHGNPCNQLEQVSAYVMQALPPDEVAAVEAHIASCSHCRQELETLRPVVESFVFGLLTSSGRRPLCNSASRAGSRLRQARALWRRPVGDGRNRHGRKRRPESSAS